MAIVVIGGSGRNVGKTALMCGVMRALPERDWIAVKITSHAHGMASPITEETTAGHETDTARYLAAGAQRAFLVSTAEVDLGILLDDLRARVGPAACLIFESNRILDYVKPDLCLALSGAEGDSPKPTFARVIEATDAMVVRGERDAMTMDAKPVFRLAGLDRISHEMQRWLRARLEHR